MTWILSSMTLSPAIHKLQHLDRDCCNFIITKYIDGVEQHSDLCWTRHGHVLHQLDLFRALYRCLVSGASSSNLNKDQRCTLMLYSGLDSTWRLGRSLSKADSLVICGRLTWLCLQGQMMLFLFQKASCLWQIWNTWAIESLLCWHTTFTNQQQNHNKIEMDEKAEHEHVLSARIQKRWLSLETTNRQMYRISTWDGRSSMIDIRGAMVIGYHARISYNLYTLRPEDQPRLWCLLDSLMIASAWPVERDNINYSDISVWGNKDFMMQQWLFCFGNEGATTFTLMQSARYAR